MEGRENPVFALYKSFFIQPLPEDECDAMIRNLGKGMSVYWEREATSAVFSETCGHPFLTRFRQPGQSAGLEYSTLGWWWTG